MAVHNLLNPRRCYAEDHRKGPMNIFKTFTLKWWQAGVFKVGMLALGISIGAYWHDVFGGYTRATTGAAG